MLSVACCIYDVITEIKRCCLGSENYSMAAGAVYLCHSSGLVYFEVEVLEAKGSLAIGFAGTNFNNDMVGKDAISWAVVHENGKYKTFHRRDLIVCQTHFTAYDMKCLWQR